MSEWRKATPEQKLWALGVAEGNNEDYPRNGELVAYYSGECPPVREEGWLVVPGFFTCSIDNLWLKPTGPLPESFPAWPDEGIVSSVSPGIVTFGAEDLAEAEAITNMAEAATFVHKDGELKRMNILEEANEIVNGARACDYGDSTHNMARIGALTSLMLREDEWAELDEGNFPASVVAKVLIAVKLGRLAFKYSHDSCVDLCGYAEILSRIEEGRSK